MCLLVNTKTLSNSSNHTQRHKKSVEPLPNAIGDYHISPTNRQCALRQYWRINAIHPLVGLKIALFAVNVVVRWRLGYNM